MAPITGHDDSQFPFIDNTISLLRFETLDAHSIIRNAYIRYSDMQCDYQQLRDEPCTIFLIALHSTVPITETGPGTQLGFRQSVTGFSPLGLHSRHGRMCTYGGRATGLFLITNLCNRWNGTSLLERIVSLINLFLFMLESHYDLAFIILLPSFPPLIPHALDSTGIALLPGIGSCTYA